MPILAIAFALGCLSALGFAPLNYWPMTLLALAWLIALVRRAPNARGAAMLGWAFGVGHFALALNWIATAFTFQDAMPHWLGWIAVLLLSLYLAVYPALAAVSAWAFARRFGPKGNGPKANGMAAACCFVLAFAGCWIGAEWLRATLFTGFAWNPLSAIMMAADVPEPAFIGLTRLIGSYGLSGVMILLAGIWVMALASDARKRERWRAIGVALLVAMLAQIGSATLIRPQPPRKGALVQIVQPNIGQQDKWNENFDARNFGRLAQLSGKPGAEPRLIFWPEAAVPDYLEYEPVGRARIARLMGARDIVLTGGDSLEYDRAGHLVAARNSLFIIDGFGRLHGRYDKAHLVPYGEYLPLRPLLSAIGLSRLVPGDLDFWPGPGPATLAIPGFGRVGLQICYEMVFSGHVVDRGHRPDFLFNPSNDAWFGRWGPPQHLAQARLRAVEEGLPVIRSTPTGISALIDADGRLLHALPWREPGAIEARLPPPAPPTLFARFGNLLSLGFAALLLLAAIAMGRNQC